MRKFTTKILALAMILGLITGPALANRAYFSKYASGTTGCTIECKSASQPIVITNFVGLSDLTQEVIIRAMQEDSGHTSLTGEAAAAGTTLQVAGTVEISANDYIFIEDSNNIEDYETNTVSATGAGTITTGKALKNTYSIGSTVKVIDKVAGRSLTGGSEREDDNATVLFASPARSPLAIFMTGTAVCSQSASGYIGY